MCVYVCISKILEWEKPRTVSLCRLGGCAFAQWVSVWIFYTWCTTKMSFFVFCVLRLKNVQEKRREGSVHQIQALYGDFPWTPKKCSLETFAFLKTCARVRVYIHIYVLNTAQSYSSEHKGFFLCYVLKDNDPKCVYLEEKFQTTNKLVLFCSSSNQLFFEKSTIWSRQKQHSQKSLQYKRKRTHTLACVCTIFHVVVNFFVCVSSKLWVKLQF